MVQGFSSSILVWTYCPFPSLPNHIFPSFCPSYQQNKCWTFWEASPSAVGSKTDQVIKKFWCKSDETICMMMIQLAVVIRFFEDIPFCLFVQTVAFIAFNKVITAQYFVWFFCLLPLVLPWSSMKLKRNGLICILVWLGSQLHWLMWAYLLEFKGHNVFLQLWLASLLFLAANTWVLLMIMKHHRLYLCLLLVLWTVHWSSGPAETLKAGEEVVALLEVVLLLSVVPEVPVMLMLLVLLPLHPDVGEGTDLWNACQSHKPDMRRWPSCTLSECVPASSRNDISPVPDEGVLQSASAVVQCSRGSSGYLS